jgi:hypothetical protein
VNRLESAATTASKRSWLLLGLCAAIFVPRAYLAVRDHGVIWSDEIFQTLEQGHRVAFGYGLVPWEFKDGARSWLLPGLIAGLMKALATVGVGSGAGLATGVKLVFAALAAAAFFPMLRIAHALGGRTAALLLGLSAAGLPANLIYSSRAMAEVASALPLAWGVSLLWPWRNRPAGGSWRGTIRGPALAGVLLGLATVLRYQNGALLPVVAIVVVIVRGWRAAGWVAAGATLVMVAGGVLDWATWGKPFQSLIVYLRFNLVESGANQWGVAPKTFFLRAMLATNGPAILILALGFLAGLRRTWPVAVPALVFLAVHSAIPHKELRFLFPVLPFFLLGAAVGLAGLIARFPYSRASRSAAGGTVAVVLLAVFFARARQVSFADIGQDMAPFAHGGPTSGLVWGAFDERNRLLNEAGTHPDICGLVAPNMNAYWTGGYTYLHRRVPLLWSAAGPYFEAANYALMSPGQPMRDARFRRISQVGAYILYRRDGVCASPLRGSGGYGRMSPAGLSGT